MNDSHRRTANIVRGSILGMILYLAVYVCCNLWLPLPPPWGDLVLNLFDVVAGGSAAFIAILIWHHYRPPEASYTIWKFLALGLCSWVVADIVWMIYNVTVIYVPTISLADLFYLLGYSFILVALHRQFRLFYRPSSRRDTLITATFVAVGILADLIITSLVASSQDFYKLNLGDYISILYPIADIAIAVISIFFIRIFNRGAFARPWIGLTAFAISDSLFGWLALNNRYAYTILGSNIPSVISDSLYVAAYLILAALLLNYYFLILYGPSVVKYFAKITRDLDQADHGDQKPD